jgi:hypothetical protein
MSKKMMDEETMDENQELETCLLYDPHLLLLLTMPSETESESTLLTQWRKYLEAKKKPGNH